MAAKDEVDATSEGTAPTGMPGVATPDQTRSDGIIENPGTLAEAATAGIVENRKRKGNLTGM